MTYLNPEKDRYNTTSEAYVSWLDVTVVLQGEISLETGELFSVEVVGLYSGEPDDEKTREAFGKTKIEF